MINFINSLEMDVLWLYLFAELTRRKYCILKSRYFTHNHSDEYYTCRIHPIFDLVLDFVSVFVLPSVFIPSLSVSLSISLSVCLCLFLSNCLYLSIFGSTVQIELQISWKQNDVTHKNILEKSMIWPDSYTECVDVLDLALLAWHSMMSYIIRPHSIL